MTIMKTILGFWFVVFFMAHSRFCNGQVGLEGTYKNDLGESILLKRDSTFYYTFNGHMTGRWSSGVWKVSSGTLNLSFQSVLDTIIKLDSSTMINESVLVLSGDTVRDKLISIEDQVMNDVKSASFPQDSVYYPHVLFFEGGNLYKVNEKGKPDKEKKPHWYSGKELGTYFYKVE